MKKKDQVRLDELPRSQQQHLRKHGRMITVGPRGTLGYLELERSGEVRQKSFAKDRGEK